MPANANTTADYVALSGEDWRLITDNVMGGVSKGKVYADERQGKACVAMAGDVSTENNGGFIQIALDMDEQTAQQASAYEGIRIHVTGNGQAYNLHLRTRDLWFPWQAYRATFDSESEWQQIDLPFDKFTAYKTSTKLDTSQLKRVGIVAIGRDFAADICVSEIGFYRRLM